MAVKTYEMDEEEFLTNQKLRATVAKIMANPEGKLLVQKAHKLVDPNAATPDLDARKPIDDALGVVSTQIAELKAQREADNAEREKRERLVELNGNIETGIAKLRKDGWTDDGIKGVREIMETKGILDPEIAAAYFEKQHPPAAPVIPQSMSAFDYLNQPAEGGDEFLKALINSRGDSNGALDKRIHETLSEARGNPRR